MRLEIGDTRAFDDPSEDHLRREIELLALGRSEFVILARGELDYIQSAKNDDEFVIEWQEGGLDNHWQAVTGEAEMVTEFFISYLRGGDDFKSLFPFEKIDL